MLTFAIGDVHGCLDLLVDILGQIARTHPGRPRRIVVLGDLIDRGPDSAGVVRLLRTAQARDPARLICLRGNHEDLLLRAVDQASALATWLANGGHQTLASFRTDRLAGVPPDVIDWIAACPTFHDDGRRYFVHAGLNPELPLAKQRDADRLWIRDAFLRSDHEFGRYVVHGHTPQRGGRPDMRDTRVNIDTAACFGGRLTAAVFEDTEDRPVGFLQAG